MAQISNQQLFTLNPAPWGEAIGATVKVGHNRALQLDPVTDTLSFFLHGNCIAQANRNEKGGVEIYLDPCGYRTRTTQSAMHDFLHFCRIHARVSFSAGNISGYHRDASGNLVAMEYRHGMLYFELPVGSKLCAK